MRLIDAMGLKQSLVVSAILNDGKELVQIIDEQPTIVPAPQWIPVTERLPEEDFCSGRGVQYSETVLVTVVNNGDNDNTFVDVACTADGVWQLNYPQDTSPLIPKWCKVIAWMPLPEPWEEGQE